MRELLDRLKTRPRLAFELIMATVLANILALASSLYTIQVLNRYVSFGVTGTLVTMIIGVLIAIGLEFAFRALRSKIGYNICDPIDVKESENTLAVMSSCSPSQLEQMPIALRQQIINDGDTIKRAYSSSNIGTMLDLPFTFLFLAIVAMLSFPIFIVGSIGVTCLVLIGIYNLYSSRAITPHITRTSVSKNELSNVVVDEPNMIRSFNAGPFIQKSWNEHVNKLQLLTRKMGGKQHFIQSLTQTITVLTSVFVIALGAMLAVEGTLLVGSLIGINLLSMRALAPISKFNSITSLLIQAQQSRRRLNQFKSFPLESREGTAIKNYSGHILFKDFAFAYPGSPSPLFESLNLDILPGTRVAITGPNASGKTTFARLFLALLEPTRGQILVDGIELKQVVKEWWRKQICYLPQEPNFIRGTIRDNIVLANPEIDAARLNQLIDLVDLRTYIDQSSEGLDKVIKENGRDLAVGIKRRIALARALATNGQLIIFDEPTESLDPRGKKAIYDILNLFIKAKKTMVIFTYDQQILEKMPYVLNLGKKPVPKLIKNIRE